MAAGVGSSATGTGAPAPGSHTPRAAASTSRATRRPSTPPLRARCDCTRSSSTARSSNDKARGQKKMAGNMQRAASFERVKPEARHQQHVPRQHTSCNKSSGARPAMSARLMYLHRMPFHGHARALNAPRRGTHSNTRQRTGGLTRASGNAALPTARRYPSHRCPPPRRVTHCPATSGCPALMHGSGGPSGDRSAQACQTRRRRATA